MALRKIIDDEGKVIIQTPHGVIENGFQKVSFSAYVKVISISGNKNQINASVHFAGDVVQFTKQYELPASVKAGSPNYIQQVYEHLKTLPEFAGSEDC
jgi:hypothetical protein